MKIIRKLFGWFGFSYCMDCGQKLIVVGTRGYDEVEIYKCPHCDYLDRFDVDDFKYKGGEKKNAKKSKKAN